MPRQTSPPQLSHCNNKFILLRIEARNKEWNDSMLLNTAWADLMISYPTNSFVADVDLDCLTALEARMFEDSEEAGPAGNQQWGLDGGQHHRRLNVYLGIPDEWVSARDYSESELECGPLFSDNSDATSLESADELSEAVVPSLPAEECPPVKRRCAPQARRVQRGRKRK
ncbi:uncharacterized protein F5891DRAFT_1170584 [Suillus fuscotomentosus]|uniref:Uncharacterized protein n=1 Tax=Suillus fuscotomentosus TaxID=1912939 RepID=A0AAD4EF76_9AGAM|nr:uncharacterized protein F5891DRAFT_1170584 [Suillus fuscotomentosus]KAG1905032.1 hypothetical protein F5891DRAFT_1170584 [Suillus fuscotomentosus]